MFCDINLRANSQEVLGNLTRNTCSEITFWKLLPHLQEAQTTKGYV